MRYMKYLAMLLTIILLIACWYPWVTIASQNLVLTGFHMEGTAFGKPAVLHYVLSFIFIVFLLMGKVWSFRTAFFASAFNIAWAIRNFILISTCYGGICPEKKPALYIILFSAILTSVCTLLIPAPVKATRPSADSVTND